MSLLDKFGEVLNRSPASVAIEQMRKLFLRLYPYMVPDFAHLEDVQVALTEIDAKIVLLNGLIAEHVHSVEGVLANPSGFTAALTPTVIVPAFALGLINPVGFPQPTGEGMPAIMPSREGTPIEIVAIPPLSPADFL